MVVGQEQCFVTGVDVQLFRGVDDGADTVVVPRLFQADCRFQRADAADTAAGGVFQHEHVAALGQIGLAAEALLGAGDTGAEALFVHRQRGQTHAGAARQLHQAVQVGRLDRANHHHAATLPCSACNSGATQAIWPLASDSARAVSGVMNSTSSTRLA
ncbi:hypothetical protein D3C72_1907660 [compost metagenome]